MINHLRTLLARFFTRCRIGPVILRVRAWARLAAETEDLAEKVRCLEAIVALDPSLEWSQIPFRGSQTALRDMRYRLVREN